MEAKCSSETTFEFHRTAGRRKPLKVAAIRSSETSVHTRYTRRHIPEDGILHSRHCENLKSYMDRTNSGTHLTVVLKLWVLLPESVSLHSLIAPWPEDRIKMRLRKADCEDGCWMRLVLDRISWRVLWCRNFQFGYQKPLSFNSCIWIA
jgi:hypothetical protein